MTTPASPLELSPKDRLALERQVSEGDSLQKERAQILLCRASGLTQKDTARIVGCSQKTVWKWTDRYRKNGMKGLVDAPGRGRKRKTVQPLEKSEDKPPKESKAQHNPPSLRTIAEVAGVSRMTVSRTLNNYPHIHPDLRERVLKATDDLQYRPDPELRKLMIQLRKRKVIRMQGVICSIESETWNHTHLTPIYFRELVRGAKAQAESLGFAWETYPLESLLQNPRHSMNVLYHRGVEGILLPPAPQNMYERSEPFNANWDRFSVTTATIGTSSPRFHQVIPDYFRNMTLVCKTLSNNGYQRIALVLQTDMKPFVRDLWTGAFISFHLANRGSFIPPLVYKSQNSTHLTPKFRKWLDQTRPEAIIITSSTLVPDFINQTGPSLSNDTIIVAAIRMDDSSPGIDELPGQIGAIAAEKLARMIVHNEKGIPDRPTVTMVEGEWRENTLKSPA